MFQSYNWYFSGSNIEIINAGDSKFLIRPDGTTGEICKLTEMYLIIHFSR